jgi:hypothetical protein
MKTKLLKIPARGRLQRLVRPGETLTWIGRNGIGWVIEVDLPTTESGSSCSSSACSSGDRRSANSNIPAEQCGQEAGSAVPILRIESSCSRSQLRRLKRIRNRKCDDSFKMANTKTVETRSRRPLERLVRPILVFPNLNVAAFDAGGNQIAELQENLVSLFAQHMERCGYDPEGCIIETHGANWRMFRTECGWNRTLA